MRIKIDPSIFRDYDIRGIYPAQINEDTYYILGKAIATYLKPKQIAVGFDARLSSPSLSNSLIKGIIEMGVDVIALGLISTEINYFASGKFGFDVNAIVSASHNPGQYNGLKIVLKNVVPLHGGFGLPEIKQLILDQHFTQVSPKGSISQKNVLDDWIAHALTFIDPAKLSKLKVVVDAGNGMGGISWGKLIGKIPVELIPLYFTPDGHFPHHVPDPLQEKNLVDLKAKILVEKADLGIAVDGDADRLFLIDNKAQTVSGTLTTAMLTKHLIKTKGPAPILYNVVCGKIVPETITALGGRPVRTRVGHSIIKETMKKENALFAGEHSGHFYFRDNYFADSSFIAGLLMLEYISKQGKPLSEIRKEFEKYVSSGEINFKVTDVKEALFSLSTQFSDAKSTDQIDGLSIFYPDWWCNIRSSKTEPLLRLNVEADDSNTLKDKLQWVEEKIKALGGERQ